MSGLLLVFLLVGEGVGMSNYGPHAILNNNNNNNNNKGRNNNKRPLTYYYVILCHYGNVVSRAMALHATREVPVARGALRV